MSSADTLFDGSISRVKVAQMCVESLSQPAANNKIVEVVDKAEAEQMNWEQLFANVV
ncbi:MAG: hypothetical protein AB4426_05380 [Xenococcaceae cyanobacterium]